MDRDAVHDDNMYDDKMHDVSLAVAYSGQLYRWPAVARFGRVVPKAKLYQKGALGAKLQERFVAEIGRIRWAYKLAEATINLPGSAAVPEIQVFQVEARASDVSESVLAAIDKAIRFPIIFEITRGDGAVGHAGQRVRMVAAHKQLGAGAPKLSAYYSTDWGPADALRQPLPTAISLPTLYTALLSPLMPIFTHPGEDASQAVARLDAVRKLEREIAALQRKLRAEPQLNRKIDLRRVLKAKQTELGSAVHPNSDVSGR